MKGLPTRKHLLFSADKEENARNLVPCANCGAPAGEPCYNYSGKHFYTGYVHATRISFYDSWLAAYHQVYQHARKVKGNAES